VQERERHTHLEEKVEEDICGAGSSDLLQSVLYIKFFFFCQVPILFCFLACVFSLYFEVRRRLCPCCFVFVFFFCLLCGFGLV